MQTSWIPWFVFLLCFNLYADYNEHRAVSGPGEASVSLDYDKKSLVHDRFHVDHFSNAINGTTARLGALRLQFHYVIMWGSIPSIDLRQALPINPCPIGLCHPSFEYGLRLHEDLVRGSQAH